MQDKRSDANGKKYPMCLILRVANLSSSAWYDNRCRKDIAVKKKPGPQPLISDDELLGHIKSYLEAPVFYGEGYLKICKRLKNKGTHAGKDRVYRVMLENNLLLGQRKENGSSRPHDGTITTEIPNKLWATDGKEFQTKEDGKCWFMGVIDHFNDEILSFHVTNRFNTFTALEPIKIAIKKAYGSLEKGVCKGVELALRADHGSQYQSKSFKNEINFLGLDFSPAFVRSPQCNGIIERFHRTINDQVFKNQSFLNLEQARERIAEFIDRYNREWLLHRCDLTSPVAYRAEYEAAKRGA